MSAAEARLAGEFRRAMAAFAPFEPAPRLAVAVSGGADSLALCLLADGWARAEGGNVSALTVDHRLRAGSTAEAAQVGDWLDRRGIAHHCLVWDGAKPRTGIQAAARVARYGLLAGWCRTAGIAHLLVGHQAADQAETVLMRLWRASGLRGLAGMRPRIDLPGVRLLRPLLDVPPERLRRYLETLGQTWLDDPSNRDPAFTRVRLRQAAPSFASAGIDRRTLLNLARIGGDAREATDEAASALLAKSVILHPAGFAWVETRSWQQATRFIAVRAAARLLRIVGGRRWEAQDERIEHLLSDLLARAEQSRAATLSRCRLQRIGERLLVWREERGLPAPAPVASGRMVWDNRYVLNITVAGEGRTELALEALGAARAQAIDAAMPDSADIPKIIWPTLPCIVDAGGLFYVPHLGYIRPNSSEPGIRVITHLQQNLDGRASFLV